MSTAVDVDLNTVAELAAQLRVDSIRSSTSAGSGHSTSSMSAADLLAVSSRDRIDLKHRVAAANQPAPAAGG